jgi:hypothetical protein
VKKLLSSEGFLYPCGLPCLRFFLPNGTFSILFLSHLKLKLFFLFFFMEKNWEFFDLYFKVLDEKLWVKTQLGIFFMCINFCFLR